MADTEDWLEKLYKSQQVGYQATFTGKRNQIKEQYDDFWQQGPAKADVEAYLNDTPNHEYGEAKAYANNTSNHEIVPLKKWVQKGTPFTTLPKTNILAENEHCSIIGNRASFDIAQHPDNPSGAGMSFIHLLAPSKARLYNGVSLNKDTVDVIDEAINLFKEQWRRPKFRRDVVEHQKRAIEEQYESGKNSKADKEGRSAALQHWKELAHQIENLRDDDFQFGLHLWPDHSVPHLHIHIIAMTNEMRQYSTTEHDAKTKDAREVRDFIWGRKGSS